jgi:hypothetical protein
MLTEINYRNKIRTVLILLNKTSEIVHERELHNEELHKLYSSPSVIIMMKSRRVRWEGHVARMGEKRNAYRMLVETPEAKRQLGRPRRW